MEGLKDEIGRLQKQVKEASFGPEMQYSEVERLRKETAQLERLLGDLKGELDERTASSKEGEDLREYEDWEDEKVAWEIKLQKEQARATSLEEEINVNATRFANEVNTLRLMIQEKEAALANMEVSEEDKIRL